MTESESLEAISRDGMIALNHGDPAAARRAFERIVAAGAATQQLWLAMAQACARLGDTPGEERALDQLLAMEPRNLYGLTMKGDLVAARGENRAATSYYQLALSSAAAYDNLPNDLVARLRRASAAVRKAEARFTDHLDRHLTQRKFGADRAPERFREARDILEGRKRVFLQQPTSFFYPALPHIQFYEAATLGWVAGLEAAAPAIRAELEAALAAGVSTAPYVEAEAGRPNRGHSLLGDPRWSALHLWKAGAPTPAAKAHFPVTMAALDQVPMPRIRARSPMALFSVLASGTHIPAHNGMLNTRLICHIPLVAPAGCRLRVGNAVRHVEAGRALVFDDSIEHEAWNDSVSPRVILLVEVWRPELSIEEREALTALFEAIADYPETEQL